MHTIKIRLDRQSGIVTVINNTKVGDDDYRQRHLLLNLRVIKDAVLKTPLKIRSQSRFLPYVYGLPHR